MRLRLRWNELWMNYWQKAWWIFTEKSPADKKKVIRVYLGIFFNSTCIEISDTSQQLLCFVIKYFTWFFSNIWWLYSFFMVNMYLQWHRECEIYLRILPIDSVLFSVWHLIWKKFLRGGKIIEVGMYWCLVMDWLKKKNKMKTTMYVVYSSWSASTYDIRLIITWSNSMRYQRR